MNLSPPDRRVRRRIPWFVFPALLVLCCAVFVLCIPNSFIQRTAQDRLTVYLKGQFGDGVRIQTLRIGLKSVVLTGLELPLDAHGSFFRAREVEMAIAPFSVLRHPSQLEHIAREIRIRQPELLLRSHRDPAAGAANGPRLPRLTIPHDLYGVLGRFDSLKLVQIEDARLLLAGDSATLMQACHFSGQISRSADGDYMLAGKGYYLGDSARLLTLSGSVSPKECRAEMQALLDIPEGRLPGLESSPLNIMTDGGRVSLRMAVRDTAVDLRAVAAISHAELSSPIGIIRVFPIHAALIQDTVYLDPLAFESAVGRGTVQGSVVVNEPTAIDLQGTYEISDLSRLALFDSTLAALSGQVGGHFEVAGSVSEPAVTVDLAGSKLDLFHTPVQSIAASIRLDRKRLEVCELTVAAEQGEGSFSGELEFGRKPVVRLDGRVHFEKEFSFLGWKSQVREAQAHLAGELSAPEATYALFGAEHQEIGQGNVQHSDSGWTFDFRSGFGTGSIRIQPIPEGLRVVSRNAHYLAGTLFQDWQGTLQPLHSFDVTFEGDEHSGTLEWSGQVTPDSTALLPRIARELQFQGQYARIGLSALSMSGRWSGIAGKGNPFEGRADVVLENQVLTISHLFIDAVGEAQGVVDLKERQLDVELGISSLALSELPINPALMQRTGLAGVVSGHIHAQGELGNPDWTANLAMVDGAAFGVPGYWMNLGSSGHGLAMTVNSFELGRDVRKIIAASGTIDAGKSTIAMTAEIGSGRAEDFLLALTGSGGFLSGELQGRGAVSGRLAAPDVEAELTVRDGELVKEIYFDEFTASFRTDVNSSGERILRIPQCSFHKSTVYSFSGQADLVPHAGGALHAHIEGDGDFLDIVDQLEGPFVTHGSQTTFSLDVGGTIDHPALVEGNLNLTKGRFSYPDATPNPVAAEIAIRVVAPGVVESGNIEIRADNQWVRIHFNPGCETRTDGLLPLVIPTPRICLGVLELQTGPEGMPIHLPGLQRPEWYGTYVFGTEGKPVTISGWGDTRLLIAGDMQTRGTRITFPFYTSGNGTTPPKPMLPVPKWLVQRLLEAKWNLNVGVGSGDHYDVEITGLKNSQLFSAFRTSPVFATLADYFDHLSIDALLDPGNNPIGLRGCIEDTTFHLNGHVSSSRGSVEYLDQTFIIDYVYADFDETNPMPILEGRASTMGVDSLGGRVPVYLVMYQIDRETDIRQRRGRLDHVTFVLEGDAGETPEQVLQLLGYQAGNAGGKAEQLVASTFARAIGRQWLDPLERRLERWTLLDEIAINPGGGRSTSLVRQQRAATFQDSLQSNSAIRFFTGSQVTVGKYLTRDVFVTYTGEIAEGQTQFKDRMGLVHLWNLEYRIYPLSRDLVLDLAVEYDEIERKRDESVSLKYTFALEP